MISVNRRTYVLERCLERSSDGYHRLGTIQLIENRYIRPRERLGSGLANALVSMSSSFATIRPIGYWL